MSVHELAPVPGVRVRNAGPKRSRYVKYWRDVSTGTPARTWRSLPQCGLLWVTVTVGSPTVCPARVKFESIPLFFQPAARLSGAAGGIAPISTMERSVVYCSCKQIISGRALLKLLWPRARYTRQAQWGHFHCQPAASASRSAQSRWPPGRGVSPKPVRRVSFFRWLHKYVQWTMFFLDAQWTRNNTDSDVISCFCTLGGAWPPGMLFKSRTVVNIKARVNTRLNLTRNMILEVKVTQFRV